ncbi:MAG: type II toxin-antitoxin system VapC family toxin [Chloroflexota bacterium]
MTTYFLDTSALAKYFLPEIGTYWLRQLLRPSVGHILIVADTTPLEMLSVLKRKQRAGRASVATVAAIRNNFLKHFEHLYLSVALDANRLKDAERGVMQYDLRTLDAIQLACALYARSLLSEPITFLSSDQDLLAAARAEGFGIDDPNLHP